MLLSGKNIVIIGGTSGLGLSAAHAFVSEGANVVIVGSDPEKCAQVEKQFNGSVAVLQADAREVLSSPRAIKLCKERFGPLTGLYHVAGGSGRRWGDGPLHELTLEGWEKTLELNLTSVMLSNQAAVKEFLSTETQGSILNMSSVLGWSPSPKYFSTHAYAASKAAINGMSKSLAAYYGKDGIRINVLAPALVETPMSKRASKDDEIMSFIGTKQPLDGGRIGLPEDLDGLAVYFMSSQSRFTTGQCVSVDGGWSISEGQY